MAESGPVSTKAQRQFMPLRSASMDDRERRRRSGEGKWKIWQRKEPDQSKARSGL